MLQVVEWINGVVWGLPTLVMILGVGIYLSVRTGFAQIRLFPNALHHFAGQFRSRDKMNGTSSYRALCTALAATVGTGNIVGVAGAIAIGGPGAILWMWLCALLGMVTKYAEATLAVRYREVNDQGETVGGPMYMMRSIWPHRQWLAYAYCFFGVVAAFGVGNATQVNAVITGAHSVFSYFGVSCNIWTDLFMGVVLGVLILAMLLGGARRIGVIAENLVPFAAVAYLILCFAVLLRRADAIPGAFRAILMGAVDPKAVTGGVVGSMFTALRIGASRGVFTNEAGMGTAAIAHASSNVKQPVDQGLMGIMEVFLDTILICTMTALVILCSGVPVSYGCDIGGLLTTQAFCAVLGQWACLPITGALCCFAIATVVGWGLYGIRCAQFLFGTGALRKLVWAQAVVAVVSALMGTGTVWLMADTVNGLMAIPNLMVLAYLTPEVVRLTKAYKSKGLTKCQTLGSYSDKISDPSFPLSVK